MSEAIQMCFRTGKLPSLSVWLCSVSALPTEGLLPLYATGTRSSSARSRSPCTANYSDNVNLLLAPEKWIPGKIGEMTPDRYGCITTYEEISLSMMIKKEGMPAAKHSSSFPEARTSSVRTVREILRHSEMLTELLLMFGSPSLFKHIVFAQCSSPVLYFFSCCRII